MRLRYVHLHGFRGYRKPVRIDFAESFTIIDGRNGVGKSTIFDAVEFALTGTFETAGPRARPMARASAVSPTGVPLA